MQELRRVKLTFVLFIQQYVKLPYHISYCVAGRLEQLAKKCLFKLQKNAQALLAWEGTWLNISTSSGYLNSWRNSIILRHTIESIIEQLPRKRTSPTNSTSKKEIISVFTGPIGC
jgi:hypothetical protein